MVTLAIYSGLPDPVYPLNSCHKSYQEVKEHLDENHTIVLKRKVQIFRAKPDIFSCQGMHSAKTANIRNPTLQKVWMLLNLAQMSGYTSTDYITKELRKNDTASNHLYIK